MILDLQKEVTYVSDSEVKDGPFSLLFSGFDTMLLYFYPQDNTPGCSVEAHDFSLLKSEFEKNWITIVWVSKDSPESHKKFIGDLCIKFPLITDSNLELHNVLKTFWEKNNYWKIVKWVIRSTFLVSKTGEVLKEWRNVKATWHAEKILKELTKK